MKLTWIAAATPNLCFTWRDERAGTERTSSWPGAIEHSAEGGTRTLTPEGTGT